jgi:UDP-3-O-[3-hydroxymyristoyl] glucosamine N-acyltransferase
MKSFTVQEIAKIVNGELIGTTTDTITSPEQVERATASQITFIGSIKFKKYWNSTNASAVIVNDTIELESRENIGIIKVKNADLAMAKLLENFTVEPPAFKEEIDASATIHSTAKIGVNCKIGANSYVGKNVALGDNVVIYPNVTIFDDTEIGDSTIIWSGTVIRERTIIGNHTILHANVSIGADGFGYRPSDDGRGLVKIVHIGNVVIGNHVEIGANSCVDRAKFSSTIIGDGCKIDNLVQIAHNCILGRCCIMAGNSGLAGSVTLGDGVIIGGSASVKDHVTLEAGVTVGAGSGVISSVKAGKTVLGYPACDSKEKLKQWVALRKLTRN